MSPIAVHVNPDVGYWTRSEIGDELLAASAAREMRCSSMARGLPPRAKLGGDHRSPDRQGHRNRERGARARELEEKDDRRERHPLRRGEESGRSHGDEG